MKNYLTPAELQSALALRDLSDPAAGPHAMSAAAGGRHDGAGTALGHRVGNPPAQPPRRHRRQLRPPGLLPRRRHPGFALLAPCQPHGDAAEPHLGRRPGPPGLAPRRTWATTTGCMSLPGLVYRRDSIDRTHVGAPHQVDLWRLKARGLLGARRAGPDDGGRRGGRASGRRCTRTWSGARPRRPTATRTRAGSWTCWSPSRTAAGNGWNWPSAASWPRRSSAAPGWIRGAGPASPWDWGWTGP